jgi:hypothetical protein
MRNEYFLSLFLNNRFFSKVIIDQHYKKSHPEMSDELILKLVSRLDIVVDPDSTAGCFNYYKVEPIHYLQKPYRLILVTEKDADYIGVVNAFRVRRPNGISKSKRD